MTNSIVYVDRSAVREGKLDELKAAMADLVEFVEVEVPRIRSYDVFFDADGTRMTVVHVHPDSASLEFHLDVGNERFRAVGPLIELESIDVYGRPSEDVIERVRSKAEMLGRGTVTIHDRHAGFDRFSAA